MCSVEKLFLKVSQNSHKKICARVWPATLLKKETLAQMFSFEFCEIFKSTFFIEQLWWLLLLLKCHYTHNIYNQHDSWWCHDNLKIQSNRSGVTRVLLSIGLCWKTIFGFFFEVILHSSVRNKNCFC